MANEEVLGARKTMFVLVIVVGCFAVLWPRILAPLMLHQGQQLKPNQFDRDAGCCEVIFASEMAVLELVNEVCNSAVGTDGKMSPFAASECRKTVNETCGLDIAAFLKRSDNVGKTTKVLLQTMKQSNSSCLKEHFGVPVWSLGAHTALNSWTQMDTVKQERSPIRGAGPHPALRERGRAIPAGAPTPPSRVPITMPPHVRVRSPLSVYFETELDIKPPPIPGMRPPLGSPGGPVPAPKSSMGFVMPIYTICIIVFFVYTLSKILFKRTGSIPYEHVAPDPQFRRRVFRDESRSSPDTKLGHKERDAIVTAISGLVAEVHQQMEASYAQNQQRQEAQENHTRPYTNGSVLNSSPIIIASEYVEPKEKTPEPEQPRESSPEPEKPKEASPEPSPEKEPTPEPSPEKEATPEPSPQKESSPEVELSPEKESPEESPEKDQNPEIDETKQTIPNLAAIEEDVIKLTEDIKEKKENLAKSTEEFLNDARQKEEKTAELLKEALREESPEEEELEEEEEEEEDEEGEPEKDNVSVKVVGMEVTAHTASGTRPPPAPPAPPAAAPAPRPHEAEEVKSIFLETRIPQQSRVLVAEFEDQTKPAPRKHEPMVVSGKMTLSLIQDAPRDTPERDAESTVDDFTTASGVTQPAAEKEGESSDEEIDEEIEIEEIEEEEEEEEPEPKKIQM